MRHVTALEEVRWFQIKVEANAMKVLIQNCVTKRFLGKGDEVWHESADQARDFGSSPNAVAYYVSHRGLKDVQVVLHFDYDPRLNIQLSLSESCRNEKRLASERR